LPTAHKVLGAAAASSPFWPPPFPGERAITEFLPRAPGFPTVVSQKFVEYVSPRSGRKRVAHGAVGYFMAPLTGLLTRGRIVSTYIANC